MCVGHVACTFYNVGIVCCSGLHSRMSQVEQECVSDIKELLMEHPHLFTLSEEIALPTINTQLKVQPERTPPPPTYIHTHTHSLTHTPMITGRRGGVMYMYM